MEIYPLGHSSFKIKGKNTTIITDPYDPAMVGHKFPKTEADIMTVSHHHGDHDHVGDFAGFIVDGPGEYEVGGVTIFGVATFHDDKNGAERGVNMVYNLVIDGVKVCHLGDLGHKLTDAQLEKIGNVDVLLIPVGGFYTIDAKTAAAVVAQLEPRIVIPMHYLPAGKPVKLDKLAPVTDFLKEMGAETVQPQSKLVTSKDKLPETTTVVVLK
ncbi:MAG: MBL fold metallo-hydrolase [Patescibacteria group bacterium]|nr:MBL fold metallo-hydrolase [Patescibacteria group bacterium]MCL5432138.1 MBL fold metallo-hydrolase [Patescibacteria group bacterium]